MCSREWNPVYCNKKKYKCAECPNREFQSLGYNDVYRHLEGKEPNCQDVIGAYAILPDNSCYFLCCDFDDKNCEHGYKDDVKTYISKIQREVSGICRKLENQIEKSVEEEQRMTHYAQNALDDVRFSIRRVEDLKSRHNLGQYDREQ